MYIIESIYSISHAMPNANVLVDKTTHVCLIFKYIYSFPIMKISLPIHFVLCCPDILKSFSMLDKFLDIFKIFVYPC